MAEGCTEPHIGHGKIILFGEHAVVHGCPALAMALPRGASARASVATEDRLHLMPFDTHVRLSGDAQPKNAAGDGSAEQPGPSEHGAKLRAALADALAETPRDRPKLAIEAELHVPAGAGLGASAALSVAVIRAIDAALGRARSDPDMVAASLRWERAFHGNPSGVDSAMATHGGVALYRKGEPLAQVPVVTPPPLIVAYSGHAPSTKAMVDSVARQLERDPERIRGTFEGIEAIVNNGRTALELGDFRRLGQLMTLNQQLLNTLLLSTTQLEVLCRAAMDAGALGAKLTGGGGGGCMIAVCEDWDAAERVRARLSEFDPDAFVVGAGATP
ncbi:MAG: mevalonate kinase [Myxococcales bacterium]|nr:mevalonate kinase [Myxococcales bacterium]MDD9967132.1 mevalonate kinase [Myxococcales bacterium]